MDCNNKNGRIYVFCLTKISFIHLTNLFFWLKTKRNENIFSSHNNDNNKPDSKTNFLFACLLRMTIFFFILIILSFKTHTDFDKVLPILKVSKNKIFPHSLFFSMMMTFMVFSPFFSNFSFV